MAAFERTGPTGPMRQADLGVALITGVIVGVGTLISMADREGTQQAPMALGWLLAAVACGALVLRRRFPVPVGMVTLLACGLYYPLMSADGPIVLAFAVALYTAAAEGRLPAAVALAATALLATGYGEIRAEDRHVNDSSLFLLTGWLIAAIALGSVARSHRAYLQEAERRALDAERGREAAARQRAVDERLRIARELHDVLGHDISLINVQAAAALHRLERDAGPSTEPSTEPVTEPGPEPGAHAGAQAGAEPDAEPDVARAEAVAQAAAALGSIKQASKDALREMRATLGLLRQVDEGGDGDGDGDAPVAPAPGIARLGELTERAAAAGLKVRTEIEGERRPVPADVDLTVFRIVQEALTNVTRHANASTAVVRVHYGEDEVSVQIDDDGTTDGTAGGTAAEPVPGNGMLGMSERVRALDGRFIAGHRCGGGFSVRAALPLGGPR